MLAHLLPLIPSHMTYVEVFGGGASLLIAKPPSPVEILNDLHSGIVNFFRVLRDPQQFEEFHRLVSLTPYSREDYYEARAGWEDEGLDPVQAAYQFYVAARGAFSGALHSGASWNSVNTMSRRGMASTTSKWLGHIERLPQVADRLLRVQIENQPWEKILDRYDGLDTLTYLDPPYLPETRKERGGGYAHEMTLEEHERLIDRLLGGQGALEGKFMLSGYRSPLYDLLTQEGWSRVDVSKPCYAAGRTRANDLQGEGKVREKQPRTECIWRSPNCV